MAFYGKRESEFSSDCTAFETSVSSGTITFKYNVKENFEKLKQTD
jgi:hypothetical protein